MTAQDQTLAHYHHLMQINAASHLIRSARRLGLLDALRQGQKSLPQLAGALSVPTHPLDLLVNTLTTIGLVEQYQEDYALSQTGQLLCQYDEDLGDQTWERLVDLVREPAVRQTHDDQLHHHRVAATQWIHTPAAIQAAEILDVDGEEGEAAYRILDLGCGSAVWSCAMAHRAPQATIAAVDEADALVAAQSTADSIKLGDRFETITGQPGEVELPAESFDLVLIAQQIGCRGQEEADSLLQRAIGAARQGGRIAVIDLFSGPAKPALAETIEALRLELGTRAGHVRTLEQIQRLMVDQGLRSVQFAFLEASKENLGMAVGTK